MWALHFAAFADDQHLMMHPDFTLAVFQKADVIGPTAASRAHLVAIEIKRGIVSSRTVDVKVCFSTIRDLCHFDEHARSQAPDVIKFMTEMVYSIPKATHLRILHM